MLIRPVLPANLKGAAGAQIDQLHAWWREANGGMRPDIPLFSQLVLLSPDADGEHIPDIGFVGRDSFIHEIMDGRFGVDHADAIRNADPTFDQAVAAGYAAASTGRAICDEVEMEVTPPGRTKRLHVAYYRLIMPVQFAPRTFALVNLTLPRDEWRATHIRQDKVHHLAS